MQKEEIAIIKRELGNFDVRIQHLMKVPSTMLPGTECLRVSLTFTTDAIYTAHFDVYHIGPSPEGLFKVLLEYKVVEMVRQSSGQLRYKRDIPGAAFKEELGVITIHKLANILKTSMSKLVN